MLRSKYPAGAFLLLALLCFPHLAAAGEDTTAGISGLIDDTAYQLLILALDIRQTEMDCSHLVHDVYSRAGLDYVYADSISLYEGVKAFRRVAQPQEGDVIVWRGHVGIVVDPEEHSFVSALRSGVKVASYDSRYWKRRGIPRFYRYVGSGSYLQAYGSDQATP